MKQYNEMVRELMSKFTNQSQSSIFSKDWSTEQKEYFDLVSHYALTRHKHDFPNGKPSHAIFILGKFFEFANSDIKIISRQLTRESSQEKNVLIFEDPGFLIRVIGFLTDKPTNTLQIIHRETIDKDEEGNHAFIDTINTLIEHKAIQKNQFTCIQADNDYDFAVMDEKAYRFELSDEVKAIANFNDKTTAQALSLKFDKIFNNAKSKNLVTAA